MIQKRRARRRAKVNLPDSAAPAPVGTIPWFVYVLCDEGRKRLSVSMARDVTARTYRHRQAVATTDQPTRLTPRLVLIEAYADRHTAIARMQRLRLWRKKDLCALIAEKNPAWDDLYVDPFPEEA